MYGYRKEGNLFTLTDDTGLQIWSGPEVAICFDRHCGTLLRHGSPDIVVAYFQSVIGTYLEAGLDDISCDIVVIRSYWWDINELNKCLDIVGYTKKFLNKLDGNGDYDILKISR